MNVKPKISTEITLGDISGCIQERSNLGVCGASAIHFGKCYVAGAPSSNFFGTWSKIRRPFLYKMALIDLIAVGNNERIPRATREYIDIEANGRVRWNRESTFTVLRNGDFITKLGISIKVGPAPEGFRWKRCWPLHFVKNLKLEIGGQDFWRTNTGALQMKYLIDGFRTANSWANPNTPLEMLQTPPECIFDYDEEERTRLSRESHEIFFEPICLDEIIEYHYKIPLLNLAFHDVRMRLQTSEIANCLEPIQANPPELPNDVDGILEDCRFKGLYNFLETDERRALAQTNIEWNTKHFVHCVDVFEKPLENHQEININVEAGGICSAAYLWITDEHGNEIPGQVMDRMRIMFNGNQREEMTGFQSRTAVRQLLPHPTLPNTKSQNLYYISYFSGRREQNGMEHGTNFTRIDDYTLRIHFAPNAPQRMKIHMVHRSQNFLRILSGMAGIAFQNGNFSIHQRRVVRRTEQIIERVPVVFENTEQQIDISEGGEKACMITYEEFQEGDIVQQCMTCKKVFHSEAVDKWVLTKNICKCVHCQGPYNTTTFRKGVAHLN